jgi:hypothetical protein
LKSKSIKIDGLDSTWQLKLKRIKTQYSEGLSIILTISNFKSAAPDTKTLYKTKLEFVGSKNEVIWDTNYILKNATEAKASQQCGYSKVLDNLTEGNLKLHAQVWIKRVENLETARNLKRMKLK